MTTYHMIIPCKALHWTGLDWSQSLLQKSERSEEDDSVARLEQRGAQHVCHLPDAKPLWDELSPDGDVRHDPDDVQKVLLHLLLQLSSK